MAARRLYRALSKGTVLFLVGVQVTDADLRNDIGPLWENFIFTERLKYRAYNSVRRQSYFWRTYSQQEIDFVEEGDGQLNAFEVKWSSSARASAPQDWNSSYPDATFEVINRDNYLDFVAGGNE